MLHALTGNTTPRTYTLQAQDKTAWVDVDANGAIDQADAYLSLETTQGRETLPLPDLRQALVQLGADRAAVDARAVLNQLGQQWGDPGLLSIEITNGVNNFEPLSAYRHKQSFQLDGDRVAYTLQFDPEAPTETYHGEDGPGVVEHRQDDTMVIRGEDGVLRWKFPDPEPAPQPPAGAVTEPTLVRRDGILHWLYPGEAPEPGDTVLGSGETAMENLLK